MILDNPQENEPERIIQTVHRELEAENRDKRVQISGAVGYASGKGRDIAEVVKAADARMYENKKQSREGRRG